MEWSEKPRRRNVSLWPVSIYAIIPKKDGNKRPQPVRCEAMKFTTLIPTTDNEGTAIKPDVLERVLDAMWRPFRGMTKEGYVTGFWIDDDGTEFTDVCLKVYVECDRSCLLEAIKAVKRIGRRLKQRAMYFEVSGYDGVQILHIEEATKE